MSKIKYLEEIIEELTDEFGIDEKQMEELVKLNIKYIHKLTKNPNVISILLPRLGILHFNAGRAKFSYKHSSAYKNHLDIIGSQIDIVNDIASYEKDLVHSRRSYYSIIKKFFYPDREENKRTRKAKVFKKLETKQNKVIK